MKRTLISGAAAMVLLLSIAVPSVFADEGPVGGSFTTANVAPSVTGLEIYSDAALNTAETNLAPQVTYYVKVTAADDNTIDDLDEIEVHLFHDVVAGEPVTPGAADTQNCAILLWDKDGVANEWTISAGAGTSWAIVPGSSSTPADMTASSGDWVFAVTVGKVATESPGATDDDWDLYAQATDASGPAELYTRDKEMLWYGEISTSATAPFGSVAPGTGFTEDINEVAGISVTYTSNGDYDQQAKSDATWTGTSYAAIYDVLGATASPQEFSLMADIDATLVGAELLDTTGVSIDATGTQSIETGTVVATNAVWLKVASVFAGDTYSGNITFIIADR